MNDNLVNTRNTESSAIFFEDSVGFSPLMPYLFRKGVGLGCYTVKYKRIQAFRCCTL